MGTLLKQTARLVALFLLVSFSKCESSDDLGHKAPTYTWPQPHKPYTGRPAVDPYCQAKDTPFCPNGLPEGTMPRVEPTDKLLVYAMKSPDKGFSLIDMFKNYKIMHDAIGFHHLRTGLNFTVEWYELFDIFNCSFAHTEKYGQLKWCNQGAACIQMGIDEKYWRHRGVLKTVSVITGETFNDFAAWVKKDNATYPYYETFNVKQLLTKKVYFEPLDRSAWVLRAFDVLYRYGAKFNPKAYLKYTRINLYSHEPVLVGDVESIKYDKPLRMKLLKFYSKFHPHDTYAQTVAFMFRYFASLVFDDTFYYFYNDQYWRLALVPPYIKFSYDHVPLPSC